MKNKIILGIVILLLIGGIVYLHKNETVDKIEYNSLSKEEQIYLDFFYTDDSVSKGEMFNIRSISYFHSIPEKNNTLTKIQ